MRRKDQPKTTVTCEKCEYEWNTTSKHAYVTCPSCLAKTPNKPSTKIPLTPEAELAKKVLSQTKPRKKRH